MIALDAGDATKKFQQKSHVNAILEVLWTIMTRRKVGLR